MEFYQTFDVVNNSYVGKSYDKGKKQLNIRTHPIDFTKEVKSFNIWGFVKNPMVIMILVTIGLVGFQKLSESALDEDEHRKMAHPDIVLPNGRQVDPTTLVPKFI